jgi:transcriptional regulator with XRE-family HTH domain
MNVGTKIRKLRLQNKMSQEELAYKLNVSIL